MNLPITNVRHRHNVRSPDVLRVTPYLLVTLALAGCSVLPVHAGTVPGTAQPRKTLAGQTPRATRLPCSLAPGFSCSMQKRIAAVENYLAGSPGEIGIVLRDRANGAVWRNSDA